MAASASAKASGATDMTGKTLTIQIRLARRVHNGATRGDLEGWKGPNLTEIVIFHVMFFVSCFSRRRLPFDLLENPDFLRAYITLRTATLRPFPMYGT
jgi:hypothetical protein